MILLFQDGPRFAPGGGLQIREIQLRDEVAKLEAQRPIVERQTRSSDPGVRAATENQLLQMDLQAASLKVELASVREQIQRAARKKILG
jgi:hypothetical protein